MGLSSWDDDCALTGSQFGVLFTLRQGEPATQITVQPHAPDRAIVPLISRCPQFGNDAAQVLDLVRHRLAVSRVETLLAVGALVRATADEPRIYLGVPERHAGNRLRKAFQSAGFWCPEADDGAKSIRRALQEGGSLFGVAKRFGPCPACAYYYAIDSRALRSSLDLVGAVVGGASLAYLEAFSARINDVCSGVNWGWAAVTGGDGAVRYLKLEASPNDMADAARVCAERGDLPDYHRTLTTMAAEWRLGLEPQTFSCIIGPDNHDTACYFGLTRLGSRARRVSARRQRPSKKATSDQVKHRSTVEATARAVDAIIALQTDEGWWTDFEIETVGASDQWVTAFVALQLADLRAVRSPRLDIAVERAGRYVNACWDDGLAYNHASPIDADSTAHALLLRERLGQPLGRKDAEALLQFQEPEGGFATFRPAPHVPNGSWTVAHPEVTAVAVQALWPFRRHRAVKSAIARAFMWANDSAGRAVCTRSFWWELEWYARVQWVRALRLAGAAVPDSHLPFKRGAGWTITSYLDAAYLLELHLHTERRADANIVAAGLVDAQEESGFWPTQRILRVVNDRITEPWSDPQCAVLYADGGCYSAAAIAAALDRVAPI
jgi:hypothetical protein